VEEKNRRKSRQKEIQGKAEKKKRMNVWKEKVKPARRKTKKIRWMELKNVEDTETVPTRRRGSRYKLPGAGAPEGDTGPEYIAYIFAFICGKILCPLYRLILSAEAKVSLQLTVSLSDFV
jgi:hypothetical protein